MCFLPILSSTFTPIWVKVSSTYKPLNLTMYLRWTFLIRCPGLPLPYYIASYPLEVVSLPSEGFVLLDCMTCTSLSSSRPAGFLFQSCLDLDSAISESLSSSDFCNSLSVYILPTGAPLKPLYKGIYLRSRAPCISSVIFIAFPLKFSVLCSDPFLELCLYFRMHLGYENTHACFGFSSACNASLR